MHKTSQLLVSAANYANGGRSRGPGIRDGPPDLLPAAQNQAGAGKEPGLEP